MNLIIPKLTMSVLTVISFEPEYIFSKEICKIQKHKTENKKLIEKNVVSLSPMGIQHCSKQCLSTGGCLSYNYNRDQLSCELNFADQSTNTLVTDEQYDYFENIDQEKVDIGGCVKKTCPKHTLCTDVQGYGPHCAIFECPDPVQINNALLHPGKNSVGSTRQYTCQNFPSCSKNMTCQTNGKWTTDSLICETVFYCAAGWSQYDHSCYRIISTSTTWYDAKIVCSNIGAHLVRIETGSENSFIISLASASSKGGFWIDATDSAVEGIWKYSSTGSNIVYSYWSPENPNNDGNQDCAATVRWANFNWDDDKCNAYHNFICEKNVMVSLIGCIDNVE